MPTFKFKKKVEDIEEPKLLDTDWYLHRVSKEVRIMPNEALRNIVGDKASEKAMQKACIEDKNEKAGFTMFVNCEIVSPDPDFNGRESTIMLPYPSDADLERRDRKGMIKYDAKMELIASLIEAAGGSVDGEEAEGLQVGATFQAYVKQQRQRNKEALENRVDIFAGFKGADESVEELGEEGFDSTDFDV